MERLREARYWKREGENIVCTLCPHFCRIPDGGRGLCRARQHADGKLWTLNYGRTPSLSLDPVEKKPLYHFHPGSSILSLGPASCNLRCDFCQNWTISQRDVPTREVDPQALIDYARRSGAVGISYTYTEPLIWFEFVVVCSKAFHAAGLKTAMVSNGYVNPEPLEELLPLIDAWNIDLKSIREDFYGRICGGKLEPVLHTIARANEVSLVEVTNLLVTGENDSEEDIRDLVAWVAGVDREMPIHFSRYHPDYKSRRPATPPKALRLAYDIAKAELDYVYLGNYFIEGTEDTYCPGCGKTVIRRSGFGVTGIDVTNGRCALCGRELRIIQ